MTIEEVFERMRLNKKVCITKSFREYWGNCSGKWFFIHSISGNEEDGYTAEIQDKYHQIFMNAPIKELVSH